MKILNFFQINKQKNRNSFTLVETMVAIFIFTLLMGATSSLIIQIYKANNYAREQAVAIYEARKGIETMVKEIRGAKVGEDGSYPIVLADDKQFIFYSDIDNDGKVEKVRYFFSMASTTNSGSQVQVCSTTANGNGSCNKTFSNFFTGILQSASLIASVKGDFDRSNEYASIKANGTTLTDYLCGDFCHNCYSTYEGTTTFDVTSQARNNSIQVEINANGRVGRECVTPSPTYSMWARFELNWIAIETIATGTTFNKGVIEPTGNPVEYPGSQEKVSVLSSYVINDPPIFKYYDINGDEIIDTPVRVTNTKLMKVDLIINVDPARQPNYFELQSSVQLRNLKSE